ncbi:hypothetical protein B0T24DRAFT_678217 [Lasiosphaeria ovina]|uniref:Uncharacterized protein n=1 Tax=Lasiosphaeria ovina TaxID=92902 RepID=A0AAE0NB22_9PEZI|nr:hypothetical protein B0T24DRAFT_678217 [Lasiosphaeria ovina]
MERSGLTGQYAIWQIVLHCLSLALCIAIIVAASYATSFGFGYGEGMASSFVVAFWALGVDIAEMVALADPKKRLRRCTELGRGTLEIFTAAICVLLPLFLYGAAHFTHGCVDKPLNDCENGDIVRKADSGVTLAMGMAFAVAYVSIFVVDIVLPVYVKLS